MRKMATFLTLGANFGSTLTQLSQVVESWLGRENQGYESSQSHITLISFESELSH